MLKMLVLLIFIYFFTIIWIESSKEQYLFEIVIFCNIVNVFTVTFNQFNAPSLIKIKSINFFKNNLPQRFKWQCTCKNFSNRLSWDLLYAYWWL